LIDPRTAKPEIWRTFTNDISKIFIDSSLPVKKGRGREREGGGEGERTREWKIAGRGDRQAGADLGCGEVVGGRGGAASLTGPICKSVPGCWILINVLVTRKRAGDAII